MDYRYHPTIQDIVSKSGTYWHSLSKENNDKLQTLEEWMMASSDGVDRKDGDGEDQSRTSALYAHCLHPKLVLLRYLRANHFDINKTKEHITSSLEWRKRMKVAEILQLPPEQILGCTMEAVTQVFPHWHSGYDKTGRPVLYKQYGKFEATSLKKLTGAV